MAYQKSINQAPLRPIISSRGSIMYRVAKELATFLWPLVGGSPTISEIHSTSWNRPNPSSYNRGMHGLIWCEGPIYISASRPCCGHHPWQVITGYIAPQQEPHFYLKQLPSLSSVLKNTFFTFQGKYYEQVQGVAVEFPISPIVANLIMEGFKARAPQIQLRYVDETFVVHKAEHSQQFLTHLNSHSPHIQFTTKTPYQQGSLCL